MGFLICGSSNEFRIRLVVVKRFPNVIRHLSGCGQVLSNVARHLSGCGQVLSNVARHLSGCGQVLSNVARYLSGCDFLLLLGS